MKKILLLAATVGLAAFATQSQGALVAYWNFNGLVIATASPPGSGGVPLTISADQGSGTVGLSAWAGNVDDFSGSTTNALGSDLAGASLSLVQSAAGGNGTYVSFDISLSGLSDPVVTFATRGTSTGFDTGIWSWSTDGTIFTVVAGVNTATRSTTFALATVDLSAIDDIDNAASVTLRYTLSGASGSGGNNRIDNVQINATPVPEPSASALLALAALGLGVRRRR